MATPITAQEHSAILTGLRLLQHLRANEITTQNAQMDTMLDDLETRGGELELLDIDQLEELIETINTTDLVITTGQES